MEALSRLGIKAEPMKLQDLQEVAELIYDSYSAASVILQKKIQQKQYFKKSLRASLPLLLKKQDQFNKKRNTNINYIMKYSINGKIIAHLIQFDLKAFLEAANKPGDQFQTAIYNILKDYEGKIQYGKDIYSGKSVTHKDYMNKGIARWIYYERIQYLHQFGYTSMYTVAANHKVQALARYLEGKIVKNLVGKYENGQIYEFPLFVLDLPKMIPIIEKDLKNLNNMKAKL